MTICNETSSATSTLQKFLELLGKADAVTVDSGPMLIWWDTDEVIGDEDNAVVSFKWTDGEHDYSCSLDEGGIAAGQFKSDGTFVCQDDEDETTEIRLFSVVQLVTQQPMSPL